MNYKKLVWGVVFIFFGVLLILKNLDVLYFNWYDIWQLWPMVLIIWGIGMLPVKDAIKISLTVAVMFTGVWIFVENDDIHTRKSFSWQNEWRDYDDKDYGEHSSSTTQEIYTEYDESIKYAALHLNAAAGDFDLDGVTESNLMELKKRGNIGDYYIESMDIEEGKDLRVSLEDGEKNIRDNVRNNIDMKLNPNPIWDIELDAGAAAIDLDLRKYKVRDIDIEGGATSVKVKLGELTEEIDVSIETGVSSIIIYIPKSAGCVLKTSTFLSGKSLNGFKKIDSGRYETNNLEEAEQKINIEISAALSSFEVKRY